MFLLISHFLIAQRVGIGGYSELSIYLPPGFSIQAAETDGRAFQLRNDVAPVSVIFRLYNKGRYASAKEALSSSLKSLNTEFDLDSVKWRGQEAGIATFSVTLGNEELAGIAESALLPGDKSAVVVITWCPAEQFENLTAYMVSILDSLTIDAGSYFEAGICTNYIFPPEEETVPVKLNIAGKTINSVLKKNDVEAAQYVVEREYQATLLYSKDSRWQEAWERYYKMIFKDSFKRLQRVSFDVYNVLSPFCVDETDLAQKLLTWTQSFSYERSKTQSDFACLPSLLLGGGSDCDSRSLLLTVFLRQMNQDAVFMVSAYYAHALAAFVSTHPGHSFSYNDKDYLMGETTAPVSWGMIDSAQDDQSKWIFVDFP